MGGGGQHFDGGQQEQRRPRRRPAAHRNNTLYHSHEDGGLDLPPLVSSPINGAWQLRPLYQTTFHGICTLVHPRLSPDHPIYARSAPVAPLDCLTVHPFRDRRRALIVLSDRTTRGISTLINIVRGWSFQTTDSAKTTPTGHDGTQAHCRPFRIDCSSDRGFPWSPTSFGGTSRHDVRGRHTPDWCSRGWRHCAICCS